MGMSRDDLRALSEDALAEYDMVVRRAERVADLEASNRKLRDLLRGLAAGTVAFVRAVQEEMRKIGYHHVSGDYFSALEAIEALVCLTQCSKVD